MSNFNRRDFLKLSGGAAALASGLGFSSFAIGGAKKKVVVVGGGIGGATAAKYIRMADASIEVTVIEPNANYHTCFMSNEVLGGERSIDSIRFGYAGLQAHGVNVVQDSVTAIDANARTVTTAGGKSFSYDRCIVSPGVDFRYEAIEGYDSTVAESIPHAWKAGPQTVTLRKQLEAMKDGGTVVITSPPNPFRCPPGPYERASLIAHYLKQHKPKSKVIILDAKGSFAKQGLFIAGWEKHYGYNSDNAMIEWHGTPDGSKDNVLQSVDAKSRTAKTEFNTISADVLNVIPAQKAGKIAFIAGLTNDSGWCPVDLKTFESTIHKNIHVIGDSAVQSPMPKSGYAANSEAKVCAAAVVALLNEMATPQPSYVNTCYSVIAPGDAISVAAVYDYGEVMDKEGKPTGKMGIRSVKGAGGLTPGYADTTMDMRAREELYAHSWFKNITHDVFG